ncbi:MAG: hypothetical protein HN472_10270 [Nitrospina sp.]|nr:hypothetical protein [Nitrospina sp.]MBT3509910.1 hypothetical protein [Nitrospina sp.]MBT3874458.1 hypothetical protein [Nitrospina sp.]MBT4049090.1 hypothetical protein [Nitrospina sp.]MBT4559128.1 hypothetical protein [Nitrospina sp.]
MKLYHAFSLIDSSRLLSGQNPETFVKVDWVCYLRDEPLVPYDQLIEKFQDLPQTGKEKLWILRRANYFLSGQEVEELKLYLEKQYSFSVEVEEAKLPLKVEQIPTFNEKDVTGTIILRDRDEPFPLSIGIIGMISGYRDLVNIKTVGELLGEIDQRNKR